MKGLIFTEFLQFVEGIHGEEIVDELIESCELESNGAYTSVGNYDWREMVTLVSRLSQLTSAPVPKLIEAFGEALIGRLKVSFPDFFDAQDDLIVFLAGIESTIHREVRKLYPDAELPSFQVSAREDNRLCLVYRSCRPFAALAVGMINGAARLFGDQVTIEVTDASDAQGDFVTLDVKRLDQSRDAQHAPAA